LGRFRSLVFVLLLIGVAASWTTSFATGRVFDTFAAFKDDEADAGNKLVMDTLDKPTSPALTVVSSSSLKFTWTASTDAYATHYDVEVRPNPGSYPPGPTTLDETTATCPNPPGSDIFCENTFTGLTGSTNYCAHVRTVLKSGATVVWTSGDTTEVCATTLAAGITLLLHNDSTTTQDTMSTISSLTASSLEIAKNASNTWTYSPATAGQVLGTTNYTLIIVQTSRPETDDGAAGNVKVWIASSCSTTPSSGFLVNANVQVPKATDDKGVSFTFTPSAGATLIAGQKLCLQVSNVDAQGGDSRKIGIKTDDPSSLGVAGKSSLTVPITGP